MLNVLAFDIETIPDCDGGRRLYNLNGLDDHEVGQIMFAKRRQQIDSDFLPLHLHRVIALSAVLRTGDSFKIWSLGDSKSDEKDIVSRFFDGIARYTPTLVTWNGGGFDLPVLHYRSMVHGIAAPRYWDTGDDDRDFRWNNYLNRFHSRHTDLMDVLAGYQMRGNAPLDQVSLLCGLPGKLGMDGSQVWDTYLNGNVEAIRDYCETDALNTYLLYLRLELIRGNLSDEQLKHENDRVKEFMRAQNKEHFSKFLQAWIDE